MEKYPCVIQSHDTTWHDGCVAVLLPDGKIVGIAAERVGDRIKHSWNSRLAYEYLEKFYGTGFINSSADFFKNPSHENNFTGNHHRNHAAATFFGSSFNEAAVLIVDGQGYEKGKLASTTLWHGCGDTLKMIEAPYLIDSKFAANSIGHFYTAVGAFAGMQTLHEEGSTMALAAYGQESHFLEYFRQYAYSREDGSYIVDSNFIYAILGNTIGPSLFEWGKQPQHIQQIWVELLNMRRSPLRTGNKSVTKDDMNIAYAGQVIIEEIMLGLSRRIKNSLGCRYLCLGGGCALNVVANGKILRSGLFEDVYVFPAPGDDGQAVGKLFYYIHKQKIKISTEVKNAYFGPQYSISSIRSIIYKEKRVVVLSKNLGQTINEVAQMLSSGHIVGWFYGRSELGPRALGHRSILGDSRRIGVRTRINRSVKGREWYRPVAPLITEEDVSTYFYLNRASPFMLFAAQAFQEQIQYIPAVVHVDGSARVQTISEHYDPVLHMLIKKFQQITGVPVLVNTSFNKCKEPIVESPKDAVEAFLSMDLDALVIEQYLIVKK